MSTAKKTGLHINFFKALVFVSAPGKYNAKVRSVNAYEDKFIIGTNLMDAKHRAAITEMLAKSGTDADGRTDITIEQIADMSCSMWDANNLPVKGEEVSVTIELVDNAEKTAKVLGISRVFVKPAMSGEKLDLSAYFPAEETTEPASKPATEKANA